MGRQRRLATHTRTCLVCVGNPFGSTVSSGTAKLPRHPQASLSGLGRQSFVSPAYCGSCQANRRQVCLLLAGSPCIVNSLLKKGHAVQKKQGQSCPVWIGNLETLTASSGTAKLPSNPQASLFSLGRQSLNYEGKVI